MIQLDIEPMPKPRQTQRDKWLYKKPLHLLPKKDQDQVLRVQRYRAWCDELRLRCRVAKYELGNYLNAIFVIQMPVSWSEKKKAEMDGQFHEAAPDLDNLEKAFQDALLSNDSAVYVHNTRKIWGYEAKIILNL